VSFSSVSSRNWSLPQGALRTKNYGLGLDLLLGNKVLGLGLDLEHMVFENVHHYFVTVSHLDDL